MTQAAVKRLEAEIAALKHPYTAGELLSLLEQKHVGDVFVSECKDGPTHTASHRRLDAWVLKRTWSPITTIGYEIKVARGDWLGDQKVLDYLPLCHYLYLVAPKGLIDVPELPDGMGLYEPSGTGSGQRLLVKKKAVWRDIPLPGELLVYVLMCRAKITREQYDRPHWRTDHLRKWVAGKSERKELAYAVNQKIRALFDDQEHRVRTQERRNGELEQVKKRILELGFDPDLPLGTWQIENRLRELAGAVDDNTFRQLELAESVLKDVRSRLETIRKSRT